MFLEICYNVKRDMRKLFAIIMIVLGLTGTVAYVVLTVELSSEEVILILPGVFMIVTGFIIIYGAWRKYTVKEDVRKPED